MAKTSAAVKNRYAAKAYDNLRIIIPKGQKEAVEAHAKRKGETINGLVNALLRADMGLSVEEWKEPQQSGAIDQRESDAPKE